MVERIRTRTLWTFVITSIALFMVTLDNLVVTTALPVIRTDLDASLEQPRVDRQRVHADVRCAAPDRRSARRPFRPPAHVRHRDRIFTARLRIAAALAPSIEVLNLARAVQGVGGAIVAAADAHDPRPPPSCRSGAASRSAPGAASAAWPSRSAPSSVVRSSRASRGSGSSGSTSRSASARCRSPGAAWPRPSGRRRARPARASA